MQHIRPVRMEDIGGATLRLLETVEAECGNVSNMLRTIAQSPRALEAYLRFKRAVMCGPLDPKIREQIALVVAQMNRCDYSLAEHTVRAAELGLSNEEILGSRDAHALDTRTEAILKFARDLVVKTGKCSVEELRDEGVGDAIILDIIALVALNTFENLVSDVAQTEADVAKAARNGRAA